MSRYHSHINSTVEILSVYHGEEPFTSFLKKYFAQHKKFGSRDRKQVSHLCYCYFRLGKALPAVPMDERILLGAFLSAHSSNELLRELKPAWDDAVSMSPGKKIKLAGYTLTARDIFPWQDELSMDIEKDAFSFSHAQQPDLFLRIRPGMEKTVKEKLGKSGTAYKLVSDSCIALPNASKIDAVLELDKDAVVQDYSSQRVGELMELVGQGEEDPINGENDRVRRRQSDPLRVWDCCAASGGKSIMVSDILGDIDLFVSDVRESILENLEDRFERAGLENYERFVADLSKPVDVFLPSFNLVIADVPCTGSGTWGRTPEQLHYFDPEKISRYATLQKSIIETAAAQMEPGGYFLYITCSVFKKENEEQVDFLEEKFHLQVVNMELLKGYDKKADTMFAALLKKPL